MSDSTHASNHDSTFLTVLAQSYFRASKRFDVSRNCFVPPPKVRILLSIDSRSRPLFFASLLYTTNAIAILWHQSQRSTLVSYGLSSERRTRVFPKCCKPHFRLFQRRTSILWAFGCGVMISVLRCIKDLQKYISVFSILAFLVFATNRPIKRTVSAQNLPFFSQRTTSSFPHFFPPSFPPPWSGRPHQ